MRGTQPVFSATDATATENILLFTHSDARYHSKHTIHARAGVVDVEVTIDGTNWVGPVPLKNTAGVALASNEVNVAAAATAVGILEGCFAGVRVVKKGTVNPTTATMISSN